MLYKFISSHLLLLFLLALLGAAGCSTISISNLHTQAEVENQAELSKLKSFALCSSNSNQPFTEMLVLDTVKNNLLAQGFTQAEQNPDFLVLVNSNQNYRAESHLAPYAMAPGWYYPGYGSGRHWPGYRWPMLAQPLRSYTVIKNYVALSIVFIRPNIFSSNILKQTEDFSSPLILNYEQAAQISKHDILWRGEGTSQSSRNAFTTLSCLAAGILEEFPKSSNQESKSIELSKCY